MNSLSALDELDSDGMISIIQLILTQNLSFGKRIVEKYLDSDDYKNVDNHQKEELNNLLEKVVTNSYERKYESCIIIKSYNIFDPMSGKINAIDEHKNNKIIGIDMNQHIDFTGALTLLEYLLDTDIMPNLIAIDLSNNSFESKRCYADGVYTQTVAITHEDKKYFNKVAKDIFLLRKKLVLYVGYYFSNIFTVKDIIDDEIVYGRLRSSSPDLTPTLLAQLTFRYGNK